MPKLFPLKLFTTSHCHLCDQAYEVILSTTNTDQLEIIDVSDNDLFLALYGTRIPVLHRSDNQKELDWPFNADDINKLINPILV
jgi:hypothetical protein